MQTHALADHPGLNDLTGDDHPQIQHQKADALANVTLNKLENRPGQQHHAGAHNGQDVKHGNDGGNNHGIFKIDMLFCVLFSFVIIFAISGRTDAKDYIASFAKGIKFNTFVMMVGLFFIQNTIKSADSLINGFSAVFAGSQGMVLALAIFVFAVIISVTTGLSYTAMGIIMPMLMALNLSLTQITIFGFFVFASSFCGYFFSPLHLCQLLTIQTMGCSPKSVYKEYAKLMPCLVLFAFGLFFIYQAVLL